MESKKIRKSRRLRSQNDSITNNRPFVRSESCNSLTRPPSGYFSAVKRASLRLDSVADLKDSDTRRKSSVSGEGLILTPLDLGEISSLGVDERPKVLSPHLIQTQENIVESQRVLNQQEEFLKLRLAFWKIENIREKAVADYHQMVESAGYQICPNCKRILRDRSRSSNYHFSKTDQKFKCKPKTYDEHFSGCPTEKYFLPLK